MAFSWLERGLAQGDPGVLYLQMYARFAESATRATAPWCGFLASAPRATAVITADPD